MATKSDWNPILEPAALKLFQRSVSSFSSSECEIYFLRLFTWMNPRRCMILIKLWTSTIGSLLGIWPSIGKVAGSEVTNFTASMKSLFNLSNRSLVFCFLYFEAISDSLQQSLSRSYRSLKGDLMQELWRDFLNFLDPPLSAWVNESVVRLPAFFPSLSMLSYC